METITAAVITGRLDPSAARTWSSVVHQVVREAGGTVVGGVLEPGPGRNYYLARARFGDGTKRRFMFNLAAGLVAAADDVDADTLVPAFCDVPRPDLFRLAGWQVAEPSDLERAFTQEQASRLPQAVQRDIAYHQASRVGDVIFNWFD